MKQYLTIFVVALVAAYALALASSKFGPLPGLGAKRA